MKALYESGDISAQAYEQAVSGLSMAKLQYDSAKLNYDTQSENTVVTAPIAGVLEQFGVQVHDMSAGGSVAGVVSGAGGKTLTFNEDNSGRCDHCPPDHRALRRHPPDLLPEFS